MSEEESQLKQLMKHQRLEHTVTVEKILQSVSDFGGSTNNNVAQLALELETCKAQ